MFPPGRLVRWRPRLSFVACALVTLAAGLGAQDTSAAPGVRIGLSYAAGAKPGVLVLPVPGEGGDSVRAILQRDFDFGDRITLVGEAGTGFPVPSANEGFNYPLYAKLGAVALVQATVTSAGLHVAVHDVAKGRVAEVRDFPLPALGAREYRLGVHAVADAIEQWITGVRGIAATRVAFVRGGRIYVVDSDGESVAGVTPDAELALSPAWHPDGTAIAYAAVGEAGWRIAVRDLVRGGTRYVGQATGLNITPAISPDGSTIVYSHGEESGTDLYAVPYAGGSPRRITAGRGSENTSPSFSQPDGRRIAFTSGRLGRPEVYIVDVDGADPDLLTTQYGDQPYRSDPDWSPDGRAVAYQSRINGRFQIVTVSLRDRRIKQLTDEGSNEGPSWAPDGRHLVFASTRSGTKQLFIVDVESGRVRQLTREGGARLASWSPRLLTR